MRKIWHQNIEWGGRERERGGIPGREYLSQVRISANCRMEEERERPLGWTYLPQGRILCPPYYWESESGFGGMTSIRVTVK